MKSLIFSLTTTIAAAQLDILACFSAPRCGWFGLGVIMSLDCEEEMCSLLPFMLATTTSWACGTCSGGTTTLAGTFELLETFSHDPNAFTQGLVTTTDERDGSLYFYEGTGLYGQSELRRVEIETGTVLEDLQLPRELFGEGVALYPKVDNGTDLQVLQLTWQSRTGFLYDHIEPLETVQPVTFSFSTTRNEGWGVTYNPFLHVLYISDGSANIHVWNVETREEMERFQVTYRDAFSGVKSLRDLNELEYDPATNTILANVWQTNDIVRINPTTGFVTVKYDMTSLRRQSSADVLNGIALTYDGLKGTIDTREYWVTGKRWDSMYRVRLIDSVEEA